MSRQKPEHILNQDAENAAESGDLEELKYLIEEKGVNDFGGFLVFAAQGGHKEIVEYLIERYIFTKIELNEALAKAAEYNRLEIFDYLLDQGADDINQALVAAANSYSRTIKYLLSLHPSEEAILEAIRESQYTDGLEDFLSIGGFDINSRPIQKFLRKTVKEGDWIYLELFIKHGYLPSTEDFFKLYIEDPEELKPTLENVLLVSQEDPQTWELYDMFFKELYLQFEHNPEIQAKVKQFQRRLSKMELLV